jgi:hypothetical protein
MNGTAASNFASKAKGTNLLIDITSAKYGTLPGFGDTLVNIADGR